MRKIKRAFGKLMQRVIDWGMGNGLMQEETGASGSDKVTKEMSAIARKAAAESCVLLKNNGVLPLKKNQKIAVFGRCQQDWFYVGYGSGGDVNPPYRVNLMDGLDQAGVLFDREICETYKTWVNADANKADHGWWGHWPMSHPEMPLKPDFVKEAAKRADTGLVVIGRAAGEDRENTLSPGSYYLTKEEKSMIKNVSDAFKDTVVVLNIGSIMDMSWTEEYADKLSAILIVWQGGMESGNAAADVLTGKVNPSGRLSDTIAKSYEDYPSSKNFGGEQFNNYYEDIFVGYRYFDTFKKDRVLYPIGFGLSYTTFSVKTVSFKAKDGEYAVEAEVTNTGKSAGRETVMAWVSAPMGVLGKAKKTLVSYGKTKLLKPGESEVKTLVFTDKIFASYDDQGKTRHKNAFVLEKGAYRVFVSDLPAGEFEISETKIVEQTESALCVADPFVRMHAFEKDGKIAFEEETVQKGEVNLKERILARLPDEIAVTGDKGKKLSDVLKGEITLDQFIAQLTDEELEALTRGEGGMGSELGVAGNAGAFGGVVESLRKKGVPPIITSDGPSGLRLQKFCALLPSGTALACTWDDGLVEELYTHIGKEMIKHESDVVLSPGLNIHRNPLCGRNFEYFSEDPLLAGKMAAAVIRGVQSQGKSCCPKHFACNNQETKRNTNDSRVSERALREIYLRAFEIAVKEGHPNTIMTSYNKINSVWAHYNYDLVTTVLRKEWGFDGVVITDWWMQKDVSHEFPSIRDNAYRVRAQVDVLMPGNMNHVQKKYVSDGTLLETIGKEGGITRGELQRTAKTVLGFVLKTKKDSLT